MQNLPCYSPLIRKIIAMSHRLAKPLITALLCTLFSINVLAQEAKKEFHDADPRNTQLGIGLAVDNSGDLKLTSNGGFSNLYGAGEYQTQLVFMAEYKTQAEQARLRVANFDERFGGVYLDLSLQKIMSMYTIGYMVPVTVADSPLLFFPSINYSYVDFDSKAAADELLNVNNGTITLDGVDYGRDAIASIVNKLGLKQDYSASLGSFNVYALMPWDEIHYSLVQATAGSSYAGFDMEIVDLYFQQGIKATLGNNTAIIFLDIEYTDINFQGVPVSDTNVGLGINLKF